MNAVNRLARPLCRLLHTLEFQSDSRHLARLSAGCEALAFGGNLPLRRRKAGSTKTLQNLLLDERLSTQNGRYEQSLISPKKARTCIVRGVRAVEDKRALQGDRWVRDEAGVAKVITALRVRLEGITRYIRWIGKAPLCLRTMKG